MKPHHKSRRSTALVTAFGVGAGGSARAVRWTRFLRLVQVDVGSRTEHERVAPREMKLWAPINSFPFAALLLSGQGAALIAESTVGRPFVMNHQVELFRPLRTLLAEMPRLTTSMCSVFHGSVAFPEFAHKKSLFCSEPQSRGAGKKTQRKFFNVSADAKLWNVI